MTAHKPSHAPIRSCDVPGRFSAALWIHPGDGNKRLIPPPPGTFPPTRSPQNRCAKRPRVDRSAAARDAGRRYGGWRCFRWLPIVEISVKAHFDDPTDPFREADEPLSSRLAIRLSPSMEYLGITVQEDDHEGLLGEDAEGEGDGGGGSDIEIDSDVLLLTDAALEIESPPDVPAEREQSVADGRGEPVADGQQQQGQERAMVIGASDVDVPEERKGPPHTLCIQIHAGKYVTYPLYVDGSSSLPPLCGVLSMGAVQPIWLKSFRRPRCSSRLPLSRCATVGGPTGSHKRAMCPNRLPRWE